MNFRTNFLFLWPRTSSAWLKSPPFRVVHVRTTLGATPSGTGVPDLRCAYPRQGISRRSCMLRRILLKVERGVRRRVCRLRSCLHIPGADQSSASSIPLSNAFLLSHDSSNQPHHSCSAIVAFSPGADQSSASSIPLSNAFLAIGTELTNLYESLLLLS